MTVENRIFERVEHAETFAARLVGLAGRKRIPDGYALVFPRCKSIHTCFMRVPIDAAYIDCAGAVLACETIEPWKLGHAPKGTYGVVECRAGYLEQHSVRLGDEIIGAFGREARVAPAGR